jgi:protein-disulfide isomerase
MDKRFLAVLVVVILAIIGIFIFTNHKSPTTTPQTTAATTVSNHVEGDLNSPVKLLVYGDFQCPVCGEFYPIENQVLQKYLSKISFAFREFPLTALHPNAWSAARAAEAAGLQAKFFQMHDLLYQYQNNWVNLGNPQPAFDQYASSLGLNITKFNNDYASTAVNNTINADYQAGLKQGVDGTPSYFLNGQLLNNQAIYSVSSFEAKIQQALNNAAK